LYCQKRHYIQTGLGLMQRRILRKLGLIVSIQSLYSPNNLPTIFWAASSIASGIAEVAN
jgi:hypothetical protein